VIEVANKLAKQGMSKTRACSFTGLPRRSFYYTPKKRRYSPEKSICDEIMQICRQRALYGYRRITAMLKRKGHKINRKKVHRIMKEMGLLQSKPVHRPHWQVHKGSQISELPDTYWQMDMTKIWCGLDGWNYLFTVKDCCCRAWFGKCFSPLCSADEALLALQDALRRRSPHTMSMVGLKLGTDAGSQFTSRKFREALSLLGIIQEVSGRHVPEDNGVIESLHNTLKREYIWPYEFESFEEAEKAINQAFYDYNYERIHSGINYKTPNEYLMEVTGKGLSLEALKVVQK
jgi:putative transposase